MTLRLLTLLCLLSLPLARPGAQTDAMTTAALVIERRDGVQITYTVELAHTEAQRRQGLMGRRQLAPDAGMLFDFGEERPIAMWMRDTYLSLDMLFAAADGRVIDVIANTEPLSEALLMPRAPARYVVELLAGQAASQGITPGARLQLSAPLRASSAAP